MIVWVVSFPRSGNTFFRIVLHRLYEVPTYVVYDVDGVDIAAQIGPELVGYRDRPMSFDRMRESAEIFFIKTHRQRSDPLISDREKAICLVRDGRYCVVTWARFRTEKSAGRVDYKAPLRPGDALDHHATIRWHGQLGAERV